MIAQPDIACYSMYRGDVMRDRALLRLLSVSVDLMFACSIALRRDPPCITPLGIVSIRSMLWPVPGASGASLAVNYGLGGL